MESVGGSPPTCELDVAIAVEGPLGEDAARRELSLRAIAFGQRFAPVAFSPAAEGGRCAAQLAASLRLSGEADAAAAWVATNEPVRVEVLERAQVNSQPRVLATCILAQPRLDGADASDAASGWAFADGGMRAEPAERAPALAPSGAGAEGSGAAEQSGAPAHEHEPIGWGAWRCRLRLRLRAGASEAGARALADADGGARRACVAPSAVDAPPARARFHLLLRFSTLRLRRGLSPLAVLGALQLEASFAGSAPFASALVQWSEIARAHEAEREARGGAVQGSVAAAAADSAPAEPPFALATEFVGGALARLDFSPAQFGDAAVLRAVRDTPVVVRLVLHAQRAQGGGDAEPSPLELAAGAVPLTPLAAARMGLAQGGGGGAHDGALATSAILPCDGMLALAAGAERYFSAPADASSAASSIAADSWAAEGLPDDAICAVTVHAQLCAQAAAPARAAPRARARSRSPPTQMLRRTGHAFAVDFWALGVLTFEMLVGRTPFVSRNGSSSMTEEAFAMELMSNILAGKVHWPAANEPQVGRDARDFISQLLRVNVAERMGNLEGGIGEVLDHSWFTGLDLSAITMRSAQPPYRPELSSSMDTSAFTVDPASFAAKLQGDKSGKQLQPFAVIEDW